VTERQRHRCNEIYDKPVHLVVGLHVNSRKKWRHNILEKQKRKGAHRVTAEEMQTTKSIP
jgi:hypothetical protein